DADAEAASAGTLASPTRAATARPNIAVRPLERCRSRVMPPGSSGRAVSDPAPLRNPSRLELRALRAGSYHEAAPRIDDAAHRGIFRLHPARRPGATRHVAHRPASIAAHAEMA